MTIRTTVGDEGLFGGNHSQSCWIDGFDIHASAEGALNDCLAGCLLHVSPPFG
jgi:hypothetical protein